MNKPLRVLIIEDSDDDAHLLLRALRREGYDVSYEIVDTPSAMRSKLEQQDWDVITSDHAMPDFSVPEALAIAKELRPSLPFIIVSGEIALNMVVSLMKAGVQDYIQKGELPRIGPAIERALKEAETILKHKQAEEALQERVKELNCLYCIADFIEKIDVLEDLLQNIVNYMPQGFCHPEQACARITFKGQEFKTSNFQETAWKLSGDLTAHGKPLGIVEISYLEKMPDMDYGPFIQEECNLINEIARRLGKVVERQWAENERYHYEKLHGVLEMAGAICHELNQPMQIISGYSEMLLKDTAEDDPIHMKVDKINKQIRRMGAITKKLMRINDSQTEDYAGLGRIINIHKSSDQDTE